MLKFHPLKVAQLAPDAEDAVAIALEVPAELRDEYSGSAGQHVVIRAAIDGEEIRRTYSLVNAPGEWPLRIVPRVHALGRMSRHLAERLRPGDRLDVLPPNGSFTPRELTAAAGTYVAFAAGCGITPVLSVVRALLARGAARVMLFYGNSGAARPGAQAPARAATAPGAGRGAGEAEVTILMDGRRRAFSMKMDDETVLDAAARAGIELPFSCRAGVCSTCRTKVVRGEVAMAQNYALEDWELEQGYVLACQSRVRTASLELDYDEK